MSAAVERKCRGYEGDFAIFGLGRGRGKTNRGRPATFWVSVPTDCLTRLVNLWPNNRLDELLPWAWSAARQQQQRAA